MKRYIKPELFFESFELSQQIAVCDFDSNNTFDGHPDSNCFFTGSNSEIGSMTVFLENCGDDGTFDVSDFGYCYHNSASETLGIFNS